MANRVWTRSRVCMVIVAQVIPLVFAACLRDFDGAFGPSLAEDASCPPARSSTYANMIRDARPLAYYRLADVDGRLRSAISGENVPEGIPSDGGMRPAPVGALYGDDNGAMAFDGGHVDFGPHSVFDIIGKAAAFSIEFWFRPDRLDFPDGSAPNQFLLAKEHDVASPTLRRGFGLVLLHGFGSDPNAAFLRFYWSSGPPKNENAFGVQMDEGLPNGDFYRYVAVTNDGMTIRMYVDGEQTGQPAARPPVDITTDDPLLLATDSSRRVSYFGRIDELALYSRALTAQEIRQHHDGAASGPCVAPDGTFVCSGRDTLAQCSKASDNYQTRYDRTCVTGFCFAAGGAAKCVERSSCP